MCDAISDAILDALMEQDPMSRVACETCTTTGLVMVMGEITTKAYVDIQKIVRETVREIGYDRAKYGFDCDTCGVLTAIDEQSSDIAMGVDKALEAKENNMTDDELDAIGAGDQGMMFGFATNETPEYMPYPIALAHKLARRLTEVRKNGTLPYLRPDGKSQVTVEYDENEHPIRLDAVVLSTQHDPDVTQEQIHADIKKYVFDEVLPENMVDEDTNDQGDLVQKVVAKPADDRSKQEQDLCKRLKQEYPQLDADKFHAISISTWLAKDALCKNDEKEFRASHLDLFMEKLANKAQSNVIGLKMARPKKAMNHFLQELITGDEKYWESRDCEKSCR